MSTPAIELDRVSFTYPGAPSPAIGDVTLRVEAGERLGILGPNGGGKSTLIRLALGLLRGNSGEIRIFGLTPEEARRRGVIGYVPQKCEAELAMPLTARDVVGLGAAWRTSPFRGFSRQTRDRVSSVLDLVGASDFADRPIGKLSGGQLQRIMIARALAARARILALDEPTVGIDATGQQRFAELLDRLHSLSGEGDQPLTILIISHDIRAIAAGSDRVACLAGRLHSHVSPRGLTPQVLAELFSHEIAGLPGALHGMHVHAHGPTEPCGDPSHAQGSSATTEAGGLVRLGIDRAATRGGAGPEGRDGGAAP